MRKIPTVRASEWERNAELQAENDRLRAERQAVFDCVNLYGDETLHKALDAIGWPAADSWEADGMS